MTLLSSQMPRHLIGDAQMDQRDSHCPYSLSSEITAKLTVLGILVCNSVTRNFLLFVFFSIFYSCDTIFNSTHKYFQDR